MPGRHLKHDTPKTESCAITVWCWLFLSPMLVLYILFQGYPIIMNLFYSVLDWSGMSASAVFVGLDNYRALLRDKYFWNALANSFQYMLMCVPLQLALSLALAYVLNSIIRRGAVIFRTIFFLPVITTTAIVGIIMVFIFGGTGVLNQFLSLLGIRTVNWLGSTRTALAVAAMIGVWKDAGTYMIYWMAALQNVPSDVYEAARMDGAGPWQTFGRIVLPLILPMGGVIGILSIISSLKVFDLIQGMTGGGPFYSTDVVATFVYRTAYSSSTGMPRVGYASCAALVFGVIVASMGLAGNYVRNRLQDKGGS